MKSYYWAGVVPNASICSSTPLYSNICNESTLVNTCILGAVYTIFHVHPSVQYTLCITHITLCTALCYLYMLQCIRCICCIEYGSGFAIHFKEGRSSLPLRNCVTFMQTGRVNTSQATQCQHTSVQGAMVNITLGPCRNTKVLVKLQYMLLAAA
jgi:hypothetical protein